MKTTSSADFALAIVLTLAVLISVGCESGAKERAVFAQNMTDPAEGFTASTRGTENEILVMQLPGTTRAHPDTLIREERLRYLRNKGFKRVEVRGSDGKLLWEKTLE